MTMADQEYIAQLEQELGLYRPTGDYLNECPRCGGVSVTTHDPAERYVSFVPLCAPCAIAILGVADDREYVRKLWECCQTRDPRPAFCMSGCTHMNKRQDATYRWRVLEHRRATASDEKLNAPAPKLPSEDQS